MIIACWNIAWKRPSTSAAATMIGQLLAHKPEVICIAEGHTDSLPKTWHPITSHPDYGYPQQDGRHKVALWSREPCLEVDELGSPDMPGGRFICGITLTSLGPLRVMGVCVPWSHAHVTSGRCDRKQWQEHNAYLVALRIVLAEIDYSVPTILVGDVNQRVPRTRAPKTSYDLLLNALSPTMTIWTSGQVPGLDRQTVCHIGGTNMLSPRQIIGLSRFHGDKELSDHDGLIADIERRT
ncbi:MAG: endonuclease/exonuclease/phosphatase family protein [Alphaproteobacteria bacterium]|nr:endonuclease/exonuclease/phosphatase family protein [Alphaproteobacteria bacterium]